jgi:hypothetical protein
MDQLSDTCPYALVEIKDYLFVSHYAARLTRSRQHLMSAVRMLKDRMRNDIGCSRHVTTPIIDNGLLLSRRERDRSIRTKK